MTDLSDRAKAVLAGIEAEMSRDGGGDVLQSAFEIIEELLVAPVSKRVERLETALKESRQWLQIVADEYEKASGEPQHIADTIARIDQALQGGRS